MTNPTEHRWARPACRTPRSSVEKLAEAELAFTFAMGCSPLVWWEEEELSQAKKHKEETEKEGWCLDREEGALVGESTAYVTFKAWNLLTSRGNMCSVSFLTATS